MPTNNPNDVELDVRNSSTNDPGWTNVNGSNGLPYSYLYTGGNGNNGKVTFTVGSGQAAINLSLVADPRYEFVGNCISFVNDTNGQLTTHGNAPRSRVVNDSCTAELDGQYKVLVTDTGAGNATIACDPIIQNKPPAR